MNCRLWLSGLVLAPLWAGTPGCGSSSEAIPSVPVVEESARAPVTAESPLASFRKIKVKLPDGETAFSIKAKDDGAKLVDAQEAEISRFTSSVAKLTIKSPSDEIRGYIVVASGRFKVEDADGQERWELQEQDDTDWKLKDEKEQLVYRIKQREYGYEIEASDDSSLYKIKVKDGKTSLRDSSETTVLSTNDPADPLAFACLGFDAVQELPLRAALMVAVELYNVR